MSADLLALVAAMPMPEPDLQDHDIELWGQNAKADFYGAAKLRSERLKAAQLVLAQFTPKRNDPLSALAIRFLVAAGYVTQANADEAFTTACGAVEAEARRLNETLPWVVRTPAAPVNAEMLAALKKIAVTGPDKDGLVWVQLFGDNTSGCFNLGLGSGLAVRAAMEFESARCAAIASAEAAAKGAA